MHELALTEGILSIVKAEAKKQGFQRVLAVSLRVGEYSGIVPACLREFFPLASRGTPAEGAELVIEEIPARFRCRACGHEGAVDRKSVRCTACGGEDLQMTAGREFYVESLKVE